MKQVHLFNNFNALYYNQHLSTPELVKELIAGHAVFRNKMIPEIEQHFLVLLGQADLSSAPLLAKCFKQFDDFRTNLMDHIDIEEKIVFPYILGTGSHNSKETVEFFLQNHEDYEAQLQKMITDMSNELAYLSPLLPFRLLMHKMNSFGLKLEEHGELEDVVFMK